MSEEELIETLRAFEKNRVEQLEEPARNLFYAIMKIAGERDRLNNIIKEVREYIEDNVVVYAFNNKDLPHWEFNDDNVKELLEILDKINKEKNNENN